MTVSSVLSRSSKMFAALRPSKTTNTPPATVAGPSGEADYIPCMFIFGLAAGFVTALATGSLLVAAGGCLVGAIIGLSLAD
ncbi:MAG: hypothetical protein AAF743_05055 [Planctomycetota bacterium]